MSGILYALDVFIVLAAIFGFCTLIKWKAQKDIAPSKKHPRGSILCEFWPESGHQYRLILPIAENGWQVDAPAGRSRKPRYYFNKLAVRTTSYPSWVPWDFLRVGAPIVSFFENWPNAINRITDACPKCGGEIMKQKDTVTAEDLDLVADRDSLAMGRIVNEEIEEREQELMKANANRLSKQIVYIGLLAAAGAAAAAAVFAYRTFEAVLALGV